jgi:hypothetical protein
MNMFIQLIILPLLLFQFPYILGRYILNQVFLHDLFKLGNTYGAYCSSDSDCDQHQKCLNRACRCNTDERRFWTG